MPGTKLWELLEDLWIGERVLQIWIEMYRDNTTLALIKEELEKSVISQSQKI